MQTERDVPAPTPARRIKQKRGRRTYDALIAAGFKLLEHRELEAITIAELARSAGYSVGAFYARFHSKDEFFDAMIAHHMEQRTKTREQLFATVPNERLVNEFIENLVTYYWKHRRFWRAALTRSIRDPKFWEPIRAHGHEYANLLVARISDSAGRRLTKAEDTNIRFAFQIALGTINNAIINSPGPVFLGQALFVENLTRAFRLVSDFDNLVGSEERAKPRRRGTGVS